MSLTDVEHRNRFAAGMMRSWRDWPEHEDTDEQDPLGPFQAQQRRRQEEVQRLVTRVSDFMPPPTVRFTALPARLVGCFRHETWTLEIEQTLFRGNLTGQDFVQLCGTIYHELRHAEQAYRVAQALALGGARGLEFPAVTAAQQVQDVAEAMRDHGYAQRFAAARQAFAHPGDWRHDAPTRLAILTKRLQLPAPVAAHADLHRAAFEDFLDTERPAWFLQPTVHAEVADWMRSCYAPTLAEMNWAVQAHPRTGDDRRIYAMYRALPMERDAWGLTAVITAEIQNRFPLATYQALRHKPRDAAAVRAAFDLRV